MSCNSIDIIKKNSTTKASTNVQRPQRFCSIYLFELFVKTLRELCGKKVLYFCCSGFFFLSACKKKEEFVINNLNGGRIAIIGHAGSGLKSANNPVKEDTYQSVVNALELYGAEGVEVDAHMSKDSVFYLLHDQTLDVSTNMKGCIYAHTSSQMNECTFNYSNEKLTQLEKCLQHISSYAVKPKVFVDTRLYAPCNEEGYIDFIHQFANSLYALIDKYNAYEWVYVESRDTAFIKIMQTKSSNFQLMIDGYISSELDIAVNMNLAGIVVENDFITKEEIALAHSKNISVVLYGALTKQQTIEAIKKSPDMIQTDDILLLKQLLE